MFKIILKLINNSRNIFWLVWIRRTLNTAPLFETLFGLGLIIIRILFNECMETEYYFKYEAPFYDTGSMISFLICLEHIYVCYYLIIIIVMCYWFLYLCIVDFTGWNFKNKSILFVIMNYFNFFNRIIIISYYKVYQFILNLSYIIKEINYLYFNINRIINLKKNNIMNYFNNNKNNLLLFNNMNSQYDLLGRTYLIFNTEVIKFWKTLNFLTESKLLLNKDLNNLENFYLKKTFTKYLFYTLPKSYFFLFSSNIILSLKNKNSKEIFLNSMIINLRSMYKDIFITNNFKHSGIFEVIWAIFPTVIIICILIPSLILLYSFEDILNPKLSVKVIGNQWYWTYEFDNWIQYKQINNNLLNYSYNKNNLINLSLLQDNLKNYAQTFINKSNKNWEDYYLIQKLIKDPVWVIVSHWFIEWNIYYSNYKFIDFEIKDSFDMHELYINVYKYILNNSNKFFSNNNNEILINKNIYTNYAFNSVIIPQDNLIFGTKRLLECDNRLVLPTNITVRFLVTSADVLHAFAMPELGFKVDAVPGRLNQILIFINRPGIFYGQCSELCGANHAFMPIVIQSVVPETYLSYIESIHLKTDLSI